ncbi:MAG TPA: TrmH family RNA methyltransferase [Gammaproteobacteria bacterium]|nr:TrmH family RNA methyltransferase [Gammaproteobacteria bacterium]
MARTNEERSAVPSDGRRELKYYGVAACQALWDRRPHDVVRVYLEEHLIPKFSELLRGVAAKRKAYHIVASDDLERLTDTIHHQGICILARERTPLEFSDLLGLLKEDQGKQLLVYLDGVENPHNFGAIVRTCAHFGVRFILGAEGRLPKFSGAACRVAEGGAEQVALVTLRHPDRQLQQLRDMNFHFVATAVARGVSLYQHPFAARTLLIMGAEQVGVSNALLELTQQVLKIPGSGNVESLNVSVAFGVCAGEYYRQQITTARSSAHKSPRSKGARSGPG